MSKNLFYALLFLISFFGLLLRFNNYDRTPPFGETNDEFMYPWAGMSFLKSGVPASWSWFPAYSQYQDIVLWAKEFRIVSPWVEKPPLYPLLLGAVSLAADQDQFEEVRLSTIRIVPIILSTITIFLIGLASNNIFNKQTALLAASLYATVPTIVIANRLSLTENLLIPFSVLSLLFFSIKFKEKSYTLKAYLLGVTSGLALLTKNIGVYIPLALVSIMVLKKDWKPIIILISISAIFGLIHPLIGYYYDWSLLRNVLEDYRIAHSLGLPEIISSIFRYPVIGHKEKIFVDGFMLSGYILLLASPFWLFNKKNSDDNTKLLLILPFSYLILLSILEDGQPTFFGWHLFPLFPFLAILVAKALYEVWQSKDLLKLLFFYLIIGASTLRFFLLLIPEIQKFWQGITIVILALILIYWFISNGQYRKYLMLALFIIFIFVNILTVINLDQIYGSLPQPLK